MYARNTERTLDTEALIDFEDGPGRSLWQSLLEVQPPVNKRKNDGNYIYGENQIATYVPESDFEKTDDRKKEREKHISMLWASE